MNTFQLDLSQYSYEDLQTFFGGQDQNLIALTELFDTDLAIRNDVLKCQLKSEEDAFLLRKILLTAFSWIRFHHKLSASDIKYIYYLAKEDGLDSFKIDNLHPIVKTKSGKMIYPKTLGQAILAASMDKNDIVFATGVAGTGKTYLAVAHAVDLLKKEKVQKIILTRPAVEAGESLGFLPGDLKEKVDPYLRPLYDALHEMLGQESTERLIEKGVIEIAPLAFMRGRTLNDAAVILDEAQNTTSSQMKMFLTRMGKNAQMIITGDITQIDLIKKKDSGLIQACQILEGIDGIDIVHLQNADVIRNPLVQKILERYSSLEQ